MAKTTKKNKQARITKLVELLSKDLFEREEIIAVSLLVSLTKQSIFFLGPPGTAKSLIARRLSSAFSDVKHFEYLMQKFSTPEEIFGPVSIKQLKKDNFKRKTENFLPTTHVAFLDEIWKSNPAILNTLLTIINERVFRNGAEEEKVPLKTLIAASNETPPHGQGLEALYDRFVARLFVSPIKDKNNFELLLDKHSIDTFIKIPNNLRISFDDWKRWRLELEDVKLSKETLNIIHTIRIKLEKKSEELDVYVSDRRWQKIALVLKAAAYFCDREETNIVDILLLRHCLWTTEDNREKVIKIVEDTVKRNGFFLSDNLAELDREKNKLEKEVQQELYYTQDVYKTKKINEDEFFTVKIKIPNNYNDEYKIFYILKDKFKSVGEFNPVDDSGNGLDSIKCDFEKTGTCKISIKRPGYHLWNEVGSFTPEIIFHKGDKKEGVNERLVKALNQTLEDLISKFNNSITEVEAYLKKTKEEVDTPFVPESIQDIAIGAIKDLLQNLKQRKQDCRRIKNLAK